MFGINNEKGESGTGEAVEGADGERILEKLPSGMGERMREVLKDVRGSARRTILAAVAASVAFASIGGKEVQAQEGGTAAGGGYNVLDQWNEVQAGFERVTGAALDAGNQIKAEVGSDGNMTFPTAESITEGASVSESGADAESDSEVQENNDPRIEKLRAGCETVVAEANSRIAEIVQNFESKLYDMEPSSSLVLDILGGNFSNVEGYEDVRREITSVERSAVEQLSETYNAFKVEHGLTVSEMQDMALKNEQLYDLRDSLAKEAGRQYEQHRDTIVSTKAQSLSGLSALVAGWAQR